MSPNWKLFAIGSALFAGLTTVLAKVGVEKVPSNLATLIRTAVVIMFLAMLVFVRREWQNPAEIPTRSVVFLVLSGLATALSWMCYYRAIQIGPASLVAAVDKFSVVAAIVLAVLFLGERLSAWQWVGSGLITSGLLLVLFK